MTQILPSLSTVTHRARTRTGTAWVAGGAVWLFAGLLQADNGWRFETAAVVWFGADLLIAVGVMGLFTLRPHEGSSRGTAALLIVLAARVAFAAGEIASIFACNDDGPLIPLGALLTAIGMTAYGIIVLHRHRGGGPGRWSYLVMGIYPFITMFPVLAVTGEPSTVLIAGWGLPAALVGFVILSKPKPEP